MKVKNKRGNKKEQNKRRRKRQKNLPEWKEENVQLIDGNFTHYPVAYCYYRKGYLSLGLAEVHRCQERECKIFESIEGKET